MSPCLRVVLIVGVPAAATAAAAASAAAVSAGLDQLVGNVTREGAGH